MELVHSTYDEMFHYFAASGGLFFATAKLECTLNAILKSHLIFTIRPGAEVNAPDAELKRAYRISQALIGSNRYSVSKDTLKRLLRAESVSKEVSGIFDAIFNQASEVVKLRDRLAHQYTYRASEQNDLWWINNNFPNIKDAGSEDPIMFELKQLIFATIDIGKIIDSLDQFVVDDQFDVTFSKQQNTLFVPEWCYKPSALIHGRRNILDKIQTLEQQQETPPR